MKNVVLLQPHVGDMDQFRDRPTPPLGLMCASSRLKGDYEIRLVDQRIEGDWRARLSAAIDSQTVAAGVTSFTGGMVNNALELINETRHLRNVPIVFGGVHASLMPEQTVAHPSVDFVVQGEGENAFNALVRDLDAGGEGAGIPGVWRKAGGVVQRPEPQALISCDDIPPIPLELVDMEKYIGLFRGRRTFYYMASRGCPHHCTYCYNTVFNAHRWRSFDADRVLREIREMRRIVDFSAVYFVDDNFFVDIPRAFTILKELAKDGISANIQGVDIQTIARLSDDDLAFFHSIGLERISIGIESGVDRIRRDVLKKWGTVDVIRTQLRRLAASRLGVLCSFVIGFPTETLDEIRKTIDFALWILSLGDNFRVPQIYNYIPYPGTELYRHLELEGFRFPERLEDWGIYDFDHNILHGDQKVLRDRIQRIVFVSRFMDRKSDDFAFSQPILRTLYQTYRPFAKLRLKSGFLKPMPERWIYERMVARMRKFPG